MTTERVPAGTTSRAAAEPATVPRAEAVAAQPEPATRFVELTIPAGTALALELTSGVSSASSQVEDAVRATLRKPVVVSGREVLAAGTPVLGHVTAAKQSGRVKGRAHVTFRFTSLTQDHTRVDIRTEPIARQAAETKASDAKKIGIGAGAGAALGAILGGGSGAAKGAAIGGAAGTGTVLATRGKEVELGPGTDVTTELTAPVTVRVPASR